MKVKDYATLETRCHGQRLTIIRVEHEWPRLGRRTTYAAAYGSGAAGVVSSSTLEETLTSAISELAAAS